MENLSVESFDSVDCNNRARAVPSIPFTTPYTLDCSCNPNVSTRPKSSSISTRIRYPCTNIGHYVRTGKPWKGQRTIENIYCDISISSNNLVSKNNPSTSTMRRGPLHRKTSKRLFNTVHCDDGFVFIKPPPECYLRTPSAVQKQKSNVLTFPLQQKISNFQPSCSRKFSNYGVITKQSNITYPYTRKCVNNDPFSTNFDGLGAATTQVNSRYLKSNKRSTSASANSAKGNSATNYNNRPKICKNSFTRITARNSITNSSGIQSNTTTPSSSSHDQNSYKKTRREKSLPKCPLLEPNYCDDASSIEAQNRRRYENQNKNQYSNDGRYPSCYDDQRFSQLQQKHTEQINFESDKRDTRLQTSENDCFNCQKGNVNRPSASYEFGGSTFYPQQSVKVKRYTRNDFENCSGYQLSNHSRGRQNKDDRSICSSRKKNRLKVAYQPVKNMSKHNANRTFGDSNVYKCFDLFSTQKYQENLDDYKRCHREQISNSSESQQDLRHSGGCDFRNTKIYLPENLNVYKNCETILDSKNVLFLDKNPYKNSSNTDVTSNYKHLHNKNSHKFSEKQSKTKLELSYRKTFKGYGNDAGNDINGVKYQTGGSFKKGSSEDYSHSEGGKTMPYKKDRACTQSCVIENSDYGKYRNQFINFSYDIDNAKHRNECEDVKCDYKNSGHNNKKESIYYPANPKYCEKSSNCVSSKHGDNSENVSDYDNSRYRSDVEHIAYTNDNLRRYNKCADYHQYLQKVNQFEETCMSNKCCRDESISKEQEWNENAKNTSKYLKSEDHYDCTHFAENSVKNYGELNSNTNRAVSDRFRNLVHPQNQMPLKANNNCLKLNPFTEQVNHEPKNIFNQIPPKSGNNYLHLNHFTEQVHHESKNVYDNKQQNNNDEFASCKHCQDLKRCLHWRLPDNFNNNNSANSRLKEEEEQKELVIDSKIENKIQADFDALPSTSKGIPFEAWLYNSSNCLKKEVKSQTKFYCANGLKFFEKITWKEPCRVNDAISKHRSVTATQNIKSVEEKLEKSNNPQDSGHDELLREENEKLSRLCLNLEIENISSKSEISDVCSSDSYDTMILQKKSKQPCNSDVAKQIQYAKEKTSKISGKVGYTKLSNIFLEEQQFFKPGLNKEVNLDEKAKLEKLGAVLESKKSDSNWVDIPSESEYNIYASYAKFLVEKVAKEKQHKLHRNPRIILRAMFGPPIKPQNTSSKNLVLKSSTRVNKVNEFSKKAKQKWNNYGSRN